MRDCREDRAGKGGHKNKGLATDSVRDSGGGLGVSQGVGGLCWVGARTDRGWRDWSA